MPDKLPQLMSCSAETDITVCVSRLEPHYFAIGDVSDVHRCILAISDPASAPKDIMVAVKVMRGFVSDESARHRFKMELVKLTQRWRVLRHSNIMECYGICHDFGHLPGLVLPLCNGTIMQYLEMHPTAAKLDLLVQVASAVSCLHSNGFVHTDIRAANILMRGRTPLLMDAGLLPLIQYNDFTVARSFGRPRWTAPEILDPPEDQLLDDSGDSIYTLESDIYSLGMTILEVITGKPPYSHRRNDMVVILDVIRGVRPARPNKPEMPDDLWNLVTSCWERRPHGRPPAALVESWLYAARFAQVFCDRITNTDPNGLKE